MLGVGVEGFQDYWATAERKENNSNDFPRILKYTRRYTSLGRSLNRASSLLVGPPQSPKWPKSGPGSGPDWLICAFSGKGDSGQVIRSLLESAIVEYERVLSVPFSPRPRGVITPVASIPETLDTKPSTLNPQPSTLNPQPSTLNPQPSTLNPQPSTLNPQPSTLNPTP